MNSSKHIYIVLSQTHTRFARLIRLIGKTRYNHVAISLDENLEELFAFARPQHNGILLARLVHETVRRYTLGRTDFVDVAIYRLEVSEAQYTWVRETIHRIYSDKKYIYNLLSVLTYPFLGGFSTYKAYSCVEFAMFILKGVGYEVTQPLYKYKPDDLVDLLADKLYFQGNLLDYKADSGADNGYFAPLTFKVITDSIAAALDLIARIFRKAES